MPAAISSAAEARAHAIDGTSDERRDAFEQHLTPPETAALAASLFSDTERPLKCLDLGCGTGMLSAAVVDRYGAPMVSELHGVELDPQMAQVFRQEAGKWGVEWSLQEGDAIAEDVGGGYDRVILNPPYRKMAASDPRQPLFSFQCPNLYAAFMAKGLSTLAPGGEMVAIVPRSWTNGSYFEGFRRAALDPSRFSLERMHVYGSRRDVFSDTSVLQETMLVMISRRPQAESVTVGTSTGRFGEVEERTYPVGDLIEGAGRVVRVAPSNGMPASKLSDLDLCVSTGKVVDFRSRDLISEEDPGTDTVVPLVYPGNLRGGEFKHPADIGKAQWYDPGHDKKAAALVLPAGSYVAVKRFSSKEEPRRVVATPVFAEGPVALENHLNFIHAGKPRKTVPIADRELVLGLCAWLNSTAVDEWFRDVSGSTQVNASDMKKMPFPDLATLRRLGSEWGPSMGQKETDELCEGAMG